MNTGCYHCIHGPQHTHVPTASVRHVYVRRDWHLPFPPLNFAPTHQPFPPPFVVQVPFVDYIRRSSDDPVLGRYVAIMEAQYGRAGTGGAGRVGGSPLVVGAPALPSPGGPWSRT